MAAENGSAQSQSICPLPNLHLNVKVSDEEVAFQEVSGLDMESEPLEYRAGNSLEFCKVKIPGMRKIKWSYAITNDRCMHSPRVFRYGTCPCQTLFGACRSAEGRSTYKRYGSEFKEVPDDSNTTDSQLRK